jgi:putative ABC transport system ATP-binding protein
MIQPIPNVIEVRGLRKSYGRGEALSWALNGVDLDVPRGSYCVLEGRSGSGKTTLLQCIGALQTPTSGEVRIDGRDFRGLDKDQRAAFRLRHIGFVFQAYNLMGVLDARENVAYTLQLRGESRRAALDKADHWLERVGLADYRRRRPSELSGGQQQRVAVARALATEPDIVLADEPTANLDSANGGALIELLQGLNEDMGTTLLIASHDPAVIESARQRVRMMDGRVVEEESV